jgi:hypothetical protein
LLSLTHEDGRAKARFFRRFGFSRSNWEVLATALIDHADRHTVLAIEDSPFGKRYVIEGQIDAPDGRMPFIRSIWFVETGEEVPRLVTAYPLRRIR